MDVSSRLLFLVSFMVRSVSTVPVIAISVRAPRTVGRPYNASMTGIIKVNIPAPSLPEDADIPWPVVLNSVGNSSVGIRKVVEFGPMLPKR